MTLKNLLLPLFIIILLIGIFVVFNLDALRNNIGEPTVELATTTPAVSTTTVQSAELVPTNGDAEFGDIYVTLSSGERKLILQSDNASTSMSQNDFDFATYGQSHVSPNKLFVAVEGAGFEEQFVVVYDVETDQTYDKISGTFVDWTEGGLLEIIACDLAGEACTRKVSTSSLQPWMTTEVTGDAGLRVGQAVLFPSDDFLTNITKVEDLSILSSLLVAAGEFITDTGPFTILAPSNQAFADVDADTLAELQLPENQEQLIAVLQNHIIAGAFTVAELTEEVTFDTLSAEELEFTTLEDSPTEINGTTQIEIGDIVSSNGTIHIIDTVLLP